VLIDLCQVNALFDVALTLLRFCRVHALRTPSSAVRWSPREEREQYQLVRRLIGLLIALLQLVVAAGRSNPDAEAQGDVLYFGLAALLSHISEALLDYPKLKFSYFRLLKRLLNMFPERFGLLPPELFSRLMTTLVFGLKLPDEKCQLAALKGLKELFSAHAQRRVLQPQTAMSSSVVQSLIFDVVGLLVARASPTALLPTASLVLLALAACDAAAWNAAMQQLSLLASTPASAQMVARAALGLLRGVNPSSFDRGQEELLRENVKAFVLETRGVVWKQK
jgi:hypothetical protein